MHRIHTSRRLPEVFACCVCSERTFKGKKSIPQANNAKQATFPLRSFLPCLRCILRPFVNYQSYNVRFAASHQQLSFHVPCVLFFCQPEVPITVCYTSTSEDPQRKEGSPKHTIKKIDRVSIVEIRSHASVHSSECLGFFLHKTTTLRRQQTTPSPLAPPYPKKRYDNDDARQRCLSASGSGVSAVRTK